MAKFVSLDTVKANIKAACDVRLAQQTEGRDGKAVLTAAKLDELKRNLAFFQTDAFAKVAQADRINVGFIDGSNGARWLDLYACTRLTGFVKMILAGKADVEKANDMQRFSVRAMNTCRAVIAKGEGKITKADAHAMVTRGDNKETASGYADGYLSETTYHAVERYADSYARRQGVMTLRAFESLGMVTRIDEGNSRQVSFSPVANAFFDRANAVYTAAATA